MWQVFGAIILLVAILVSGCSPSPDEPNPPAIPPTPTSVPPTATPTPTPIQISATDLIQAYEDNEVAAQSKYAGQTALVTGEVSSITEAGSKYDVDLRTDEIFHLSDVVCKVSKDYEASMINLTSGQTLTVAGTIKGKGIFDIVIEPCVIQ